MPLSERVDEGHELHGSPPVPLDGARVVEVGAVVVGPDAASARTLPAATTGPVRAATESGAGSRSTRGGGIRKRRRPYWAMSANTGAATEPP